LLPAQKFENEITEDRDRIKALGEVFTPTSLVEYVLDFVKANDPNAFNDSKTFIDSMCGDGQFLVAIKKRKLAEEVSESDASNSIYGIDLTQGNVDSTKARTASPNIICANSLGDTFSKTKNKTV
jgi:type I restriction-modification system DNA methylase subunit